MPALERENRMNEMFTIRVGDYIIYPAFFVLLFALLILIAVVVFVVNLLRERKEEHSADDNYKITEWQRKHVVRLCRDYIKDNNMSEYEDNINRLERYILDSTYWNLDEMLDIDDNIIKESTIVMFLAAQDSYLLKQYDDAVLLLNTIDIMNGGPDNPEYMGGEYPWIGEDIPEMRNHQDMTEEEVRTLHLYFSSIADLLSFVDKDLGKIPEDSPAPDYCKRITQKDMEECAGDLISIVDIRAIKPENREVLCKALFLNVSITLSGIFMGEEKVLDEEGKEIRYVDEYRRYSIRALASAIDGQLYSDVIDSIDE